MLEPYHHILNIKEDYYPKKYSHLIRRLQKAVSDSERKKRLDFEAGMLYDLKADAAADIHVGAEDKNDFRRARPYYRSEC